MKCAGIAAAAALVAMVVAAPVAAQITVTSNGREGPTTCVGEAEIDAANMPITALSNSSMTVTVPAVTWSQFVGRFSDGQSPSSAFIRVAVFNAKTGARKGGEVLLRDLSSSNPNYGGVTGQVFSGLDAKTPYESWSSTRRASARWLGDRFYPAISVQIGCPWG